MKAIGGTSTFEEKIKPSNIIEVHGAKDKSTNQQILKTETKY